MTEIHLENWEGFLEELKNLREKYRQRANEKGPPPSPLLFRGQENSCLPLTTTLERPPDERKGMPFGQYYLSIYKVKHEIESFTGKNWELPGPSELEKAMRAEPFTCFTKEDNKTWCPVYSYMVYLRHHGFPSPLLDWTSSPYVASFFAFRRAIAANGKVSIYVYCEMPKPREDPKVSSSDRPEIILVSKLYVRTHPRHFLQQSDYTICVKEIEKEYCFAPHEDVFARGDPDHDVLRKFNIPSTERRKVLKLLNDDYNINAFSLFGSEESLMETMALRELDFREKDS